MDSQVSRSPDALLQNMPAQLHGRPDLVEEMTEELRRLL